MSTEAQIDYTNIMDVEELKKIDTPKGMFGLRDTRLTGTLLLRGKYFEIQVNKVASWGTEVQRQYWGSRDQMHKIIREKEKIGFALVGNRGYHNPNRQDSFCEGEIVSAHYNDNLRQMPHHAFRDEEKFGQYLICVIKLKNKMKLEPYGNYPAAEFEGEVTIVMDLEQLKSFAEFESYDYKTDTSVIKLFGLSITTGMHCQGPVSSYATNDSRFPAIGYSSIKNTYSAEFQKAFFPALTKAVTEYTNWLDVINMGKKEGITKTLSKIGGYVEKYKATYPMATALAGFLGLFSHRTIEKVSCSALFNTTFAVKTEEEYVEVLKKIEEMDWSFEQNAYSLEFILQENMKNLGSFSEKRKKAIKADAGKAFHLLSQEHESLALDEKKYPLVTAAIYSGEIPLGTFFRKKEQYFIFNDQWELWEGMMKLDRATTIELAKTVSTRTTYGKELMSYFYFVLYRLPGYLERHTKVAWKVLPKLVDSTDSLEPEPQKDGEPRRKRSALTPIVDNEAHTVHVPYAALVVSGGYGTTYAYAKDYQILMPGLSHEGSVVTNEIERGLNGKDDYGLMYYTLSGSSNGTGYPTFLIIFEKFEWQKRGVTRVHFHRVHPSRSKNEDINGVNNWIKTGYNWMAGNVNRERIVVTQGDLFFVKAEKMPEGEYKEVTVYDSHQFERPLPMLMYEGKDKSVNILGFVKIEEDVLLKHPEHENRIIPAGNYEIRQCRSWEANPRGIWTLRID